MNFPQVCKSLLSLFVFIFLSAYFFHTIDFFMNGLGDFFYQKTMASVSDSFGPENVTIENPVVQPKQELKPAIRAEQELTIDAESVMSVKVFNGQQKVLFSKNDQEVLLIASLTKLMTAIVSLDNYDFSQTITISKAAVVQGGFFKAGETFPVRTLLYAALIGSDNSAAYALSELMGKEKFVNLMNAKAQELGLLNTYYDNSVGFGLKNYSTAQELVILTHYILEKYPLIFQITLLPEFDVYDLNGKFHHKVLATNLLLTDPSFDERSAILGSKTGNNAKAGMCLVLVLKSPDNKGYLVNVILSSKDSFGEMKKLINWESVNPWQ